MWGPTLFATCVPLLCGLLLVVGRLAYRQGKLVARVDSIERDSRDTRDDVRNLTEALLGRLAPSERRDRMEGRSG